MSHLVAPSHTAVHAIPLGRRIREIMKAKGNYYSIAAMSVRIGINRETFRAMLNGEREIYTFELERISQDLKLPVERILQQDISAIEDQLDDLLQHRNGLDQALALALQVLEAAIGISELCSSLNTLGYIYFWQREIKSAHQTWLEAYEYAQQISKWFDDNQLLYRVLRNLMSSYTERKEYDKALEIVELVEPTFHSHPGRMSALYYTRAKFNEYLGKMDEATHLSYKSLEQSILFEDKDTLGRAYINVAHYEYLKGNYLLAKEHLLRSLELLTQSAMRLIAGKELVKVLLKRGENKQAEEMICFFLRNEDLMSHPHLEGKLLVLLSRATNISEYAERVVANHKYGEVVRYLSCKYLINHYRELGDIAKSMHYYESAEVLLGSPTDVLDEGDL